MSSWSFYRIPRRSRWHHDPHVKRSANPPSRRRSANRGTAARWTASGGSAASTTCPSAATPATGSPLPASPPWRTEECGSPRAARPVVCPSGPCGNAVCHIRHNVKRDTCGYGKGKSPLLGKTPHTGLEKCWLPGCPALLTARRNRRSGSGSSISGKMAQKALLWRITANNPSDSSSDSRVRLIKIPSESMRGG